MIVTDLLSFNAFIYNGPELKLIHAHAQTQTLAHTFGPVGTVTPSIRVRHQT